MITKNPLLLHHQTPDTSEFCAPQQEHLFSAAVTSTAQEETEMDIDPPTAAASSCSAPSCPGTDGEVPKAAGYLCQ